MFKKRIENNNLSVVFGMWTKILLKLKANTETISALYESKIQTKPGGYAKTESYMSKLSG